MDKPRPDRLARWLFRLLNPVDGDLIQFDGTNRIFRNQTALTALPSHDNTKHDNRTRRFYAPARVWGAAQDGVLVNPTVVHTTSDIRTEVGYNVFRDAVAADSDQVHTIITVPTDYVEDLRVTAYFGGDGSASAAAVFAFHSIVVNDAVDFASATLNTSSLNSATISATATIRVGSAKIVPGTYVAGDELWVAVTRRPDHASDLYGATIKFLGAEFSYTADA